MNTGAAIGFLKAAFAAGFTPRLDDDAHRAMDDLAQTIRKTVASGNRPRHEVIKSIEELEGLRQMNTDNLNAALDEFKKYVAEGTFAERISDQDFVQEMYETYNGLTEEEIIAKFEEEGVEGEIKLLSLEKAWLKALKQERFTSDTVHRIEELKKVYHCLHPRLLAAAQRVAKYAASVAFKFPVCQHIFDEYNGHDPDSIHMLYDSMDVLKFHNELLCEATFTNTELVKELLSIKHLLHPDFVKHLEQFIDSPENTQSL